MDLAENRFRKTWERFLEVLKVDCHEEQRKDIYSDPSLQLIYIQQVMR